MDNDVSAFSGKPRPAYRRLLANLADGARHAVVVYHVDRLTRRPFELEQFLEVVTAASVHNVRFVAVGTLTSAMGTGSCWCVCSRSWPPTRRRPRAAGCGASSTRWPPPADPMVAPTAPSATRPTSSPSAQPKRKLCERSPAATSAGESLLSLATWLNGEGVRTVTGRPGAPRRCARCSCPGALPACASTGAKSSAPPSGSPSSPRGTGQAARSLCRGRPHRTTPPPYLPAHRPAALRQVRPPTVQLGPQRATPLRVPIGARPRRLWPP